MTPQTTHDPLERELSALFATPVSYDAGEVTESVHAGVRQVRKTRRRRRVLAGTSALALAGIVTAAALNGSFSGAQLAPAGATSSAPTYTTGVPQVGEPIPIPKLSDPSEGYATEPNTPAGPLTASELRALVRPDLARRIDDTPITDAPRLSSGLVQRRDLAPGFTEWHAISLYASSQMPFWMMQQCPDTEGSVRGPQTEMRAWALYAPEQVGSETRPRPRVSVTAFRFVNPTEAGPEYHKLLSNTGACRLREGHFAERYRVPDGYPVADNRGEPVDLKGVSFRLADDTIVVVSDISKPGLFGKFDTKRLADNVVARLQLSRQG